MVQQSFGQRVDAVKEFAKENAANDKAWKIVAEEMEDSEIYHIVKQTQSPEGAIRKIARMIGSEHGARIDLPAPSRVQSMNEAERKLLALAGTEGSYQPYDDAEHHVPAAEALRAEEARRAVRGKGTHHAGGHPHHEETTAEQIAALEKKEAADAKKAAAAESKSTAVTKAEDQK